MSRYLRVLAATILLVGFAAAIWLPASDLDFCPRVSWFECGANSEPIIRGMIATTALLASVVIYSLGGLHRR